MERVVQSSCILVFPNSQACWSRNSIARILIKKITALSDSNDLKKRWGKRSWSGGNSYRWASPLPNGKHHHICHILIVGIYLLMFWPNVSVFDDILHANSQDGICQVLITHNMTFQEFAYWYTWRNRFEDGSAENQEIKATGWVQVFSYFMCFPSTWKVNWGLKIFTLTTPCI